MKKTKRVSKWVEQLNQKKFVGNHLIADFWYGKIIENPKEIKKILIEAAKASNSTPLEVVIHKFTPEGITGVVLVSESHIAIHTWPELNYMAVDIFTCGSHTFPKKAFQYLKSVFQPKKVNWREIKRGKVVKK